MSKTIQMPKKKSKFAYQYLGQRPHYDGFIYHDVYNMSTKKTAVIGNTILLQMQKAGNIEMAVKCEIPR